MKVPSAGLSLSIDTAPVSLWLQSIKKTASGPRRTSKSAPSIEVPWQVRVSGSGDKKTTKKDASR